MSTHRHAALGGLITAAGHITAAVNAATGCSPVSLTHNFYHHNAMTDTWRHSRTTAASGWARTTPSTSVSATAPRRAKSSRTASTATSPGTATRYIALLAVQCCAACCGGLLTAVPVRRCDPVLLLSHRWTRFSRLQRLATSHGSVRSRHRLSEASLNSPITAYCVCILVL
jgi:hypothetical protein